MTAQEVGSMIRVVLCDALGLDEDEIKPTSTLMGNLGAESIDFLDIVFRLEEVFGIKIPRGEFFPEHFFNDPHYVDLKTGKLTEEGFREIRNKIPFFDLSRFKDDTEVKVVDLYTVDMLTRYICGKLDVQA